ncbi:MAG: survival protein SurE [Actinobacteria bacterium]|nr:survival protein SurE [Actinomycetota bacterium]
MMSRRRSIAALVLAFVAATLVGLPASASTAEKKVAKLRILVTNDDGVEGEGMHALVTALLEEPKVQVSVVAPAENQSGTSDKVSPPPLVATETTLPDGTDAVAVNGFPADSVIYALDELGLKPHVVISGINEGQNLGPIGQDVSGTVGAAKTAVRRGIPALAVSQGLGDPPDYESGVKYAIEWLREHRKELTKAKGKGATTVANLNVPTCLIGEVRGLKEVPAATSDVDLVLAAEAVQCDSTLGDPPDDAQAFKNGFAALSEVTPEPE